MRRLPRMFWLVSYCTHSSFSVYSCYHLSLYMPLTEREREMSDVIFFVVVLVMATFSFGDSGGPLLQFAEDDEPVLVGVVSRGASGCYELPSIYARVSAHVGSFIPRSQITIPSISPVQVMLSSPSLKGPNSTPIEYETEQSSSDDSIMPSQEPGPDVSYSF